MSLLTARFARPVVRLTEANLRVPLHRLAHWLTHKNEIGAVDAILVLDGADDRWRFKAALNLLHLGYAPRILVSRSIYGSETALESEGALEGLSENIQWLYNKAVSTREEAIEVRRALKELHCASVLIVTSRCHTRRAREIYSRELSHEGIRVQVFGAPAPNFDESCWWKTQAGRATVLVEFAKMLATWLHLDPPLPSSARHHLKCWLMRCIP